MIYHVVQRQNPQDRSAPALWYPTLTWSGEVSLRQLAEDISQGTTLSTTDVTAVIESLLHRLPIYLENGHSVRLGDFGIIRPSLKTTGTEKKDDVTAKNIEAVKVLFLASKELKRKFEGVKFHKSSLNGKEDEAAELENEEV